jgi:hypothetical protein
MRRASGPPCSCFTKTMLAVCRNPWRISTRQRGVGQVAGVDPKASHPASQTESRCWFDPQNTEDQCPNTPNRPKPQPGGRQVPGRNSHAVRSCQRRQWSVGLPTPSNPGMKPTFLIVCLLAAFLACVSPSVPAPVSDPPTPLAKEPTVVRPLTRTNDIPPGIYESAPFTVGGVPARELVYKFSRLPQRVDGENHPRLSTQHPGLEPADDLATIIPCQSKSESRCISFWRLC